MLRELVQKAVTFFNPQAGKSSLAPSSIYGLSNGSLMPVTFDNALQFSTVYSCVRILSTNIASLPLEVYKATANGKDIDTKNPYHRMLCFSPDSQISSRLFVQTVVSQMLIFGNAFGKITRFAGRVANIRLMRPERMTVKVTPEGETTYLYQSDSGRTEYTADEVLHFRNVTVDGSVGASPIQQMRTSIGLGMQSLHYANRLYANNGRPSGVLVNHAPGEVDDAQLARIKAGWESQASGDNVGRTAVLPSSLEYKPLSMSLADAEFISTHKLSVSTVASMYGVPLFLLQADDNPVYAGLAEASRTFRDLTLRPLMDQITDTLNFVVFGYGSPYSVEFDTSKLLSNDQESRFKAYSSALAGQPWLTVNEVREQEGWNRLSENHANSLREAAAK